MGVLMLLPMRPAAMCALCATLAILPVMAAAQDYDGLYRPDDAEGATWTCRLENLGSFGGALGIIDGTFHGVENTCELSDPRPHDGGHIFTTSCFSEGETYPGEKIIRPTATGISIESEGYVAGFRRCG
jgi:hypothetical protein